MWKHVTPGEWPFWAIGMDALWQHRRGFWLSARTNDYSTLWELRDTEGAVLTNQLDLPFKEGIAGAPLGWADTELALRKAA